MSEKHVECLHSQISVVLFSDHLQQSILGGDQFGTGAAICSQALAHNGD